MVQIVKCPNCGAEIPLDEAISHQLREELRAEFEQKAQVRETEMAKKQSELAVRERKLSDSEKSLDDQVVKRLAQERAKIEADVRKRLSETSAVEMADLKNQVAEKARALDEAQKRELGLRKQHRQLEDEKRDLEFEVTRRLDEERHVVSGDTIHSRGLLAGDCLFVQEESVSCPRKSCPRKSGSACHER